MTLAKPVTMLHLARLVPEVSSLETTSVLLALLTSTSVEISVLRAARTAFFVTQDQMNVKCARMVSSFHLKVHASKKS